MAEIKIEKKKAIWPWILLVLVAIGLIWYFFMREPDNKVVNDEDTTENVIVQNNNVGTMSAIAAYSAYIGDTSKMGVDHEYSQGALTHLIDATEEKADMLNVDLGADLDEARAKAWEITENPNELDHANLIKDSGKIITRALTTLQKDNYPNLETDVEKVDAANSAIKKAVKTLDQKDVINNFFKSAESLLLKMQ